MGLPRRKYFTAVSDISYCGHGEGKVVLTVVVPAAHTQTDMQNRPLPKLRSQVILLVWVGDQSVVRCHHSDVEVDEITEERRLVGTWVARRHWREEVSNRCRETGVGYIRFSFQWLSTFQCVYGSRGLFC